MFKHFFPEDLIANAQLCLRLASEHCSNCSGFHLSSIIRRATLPSNQRIADFAEFNQATSLVLADLIKRKQSIHIVVGGTTDTCLYVGLLNAAAQVGGKEFAQSLTVTIVDQCQTPLQICQNYADLHDLKPTIVQSDFLKMDLVVHADLVLLHGVLSFFPAEKRHEYLRHISGWLSPDGVLLSSTQLGQKRGNEESNKRITHGLSNLRKLMTENAMHDEEQRDILEQQLTAGVLARNRHEELFANEDEAISFYENAGLEVESFSSIDNSDRTVDGLERRYQERGIAKCRVSRGEISEF
ncbi:MAG: class I SAM-dependent methyltransferase [Hyphomicrobiales bacterium]